MLLPARGRHCGAERAICRLCHAFIDFLLISRRTFISDIHVYHYTYILYMCINCNDDQASLAQNPLDRFSQSFHRMKALSVQMIDLDLFFSISQATLPWQPILRKKWQTPHFRRSGIQKRNGISLPQCEALTAQMMPTSGTTRPKSGVFSQISPDILDRFSLFTIRKRFTCR